MVNLRNKNGDLILGAREVPAGESVDEMINDLSKTKQTIAIKVDGLSWEDRDLQALNKAIEDLHNSGSIDKLDISNGTHTFRELYDIINRPH